MFISKIIELANKKTKDYFDSQAEDYEKAGNFQEPKRCYEETLKEVGKCKASIRVLDVGCGTGAMLRKICDAHLDIMIAEGIDLSGAMVERAEKLSGEYPITFYEGTLEDVDLGKKKYNLLLCMHSFHHYPRPLKSLKAMKKILCNGGKLIIVENRKEGWERLQSNFDLIKNGFPDGDLWKYSKYELTFLVKLAGFKRVGYRKCGERSFMLICQTKNN